MKTETEIIIVRHGQTQSNQLRRIQGQSDSPLSELGQQQALALSRRISSTYFAKLFSSDLGRAMATAEILAKPLGLSVEACPALRETCFGEAEGHTWEAVHERYPEQAADWYKHVAEARLPGGESREEVTERVMKFFEKAVSDYQGQRLLMVTHGGVLACVFSRILQIPAGIRPQCVIENTSLNILSFKDQRWKIKTWGDVQHFEVLQPQF